MKETVLIAQSWILYYFWILNALYFLLLFFGFFVIFSRTQKMRMGRLELFFSSEGLPSIGIIVPAYNEALNLPFAIHALLNLRFPNKTLIIVNDGSSDDTLPLLKTTFKLRKIPYTYREQVKTNQVRGVYLSLLYPELLVVDKVNGGKSDAINAGLNVSSSEYTLVIDADTIIDEGEFTSMLRFLFTTPEIRAYGASVRVANGCEVKLRGIATVGFPKAPLAAFQAVEYMRAFYLGRMGWDFFGGALIISGAFSFFETHALRDIGGYSTKTVAEDMEIVVRYKREQILKKENHRTGFVAEPVCWTEVPETLKMLEKQRMRWQVGIMEVLWMHKRMFFNPRYGLTGMLTYPYFVIGEMLSPFVEAVGYVVIFASFFLGMEPFLYLLFFFSITVGLTFLMNVVCIAIETWFYRKYRTYGQIGKMLFYGFLENLGYRQLTIYWRLKALYRFFRRPKQWKEIQKTGFGASKR